MFKRKKISKGKAVSITENLTEKRINEMKVARETYGFKNIWSEHGKFYILMQMIETRLRNFTIKSYSDG